MVSVEGFEPPSCWFVASCTSIVLHRYGAATRTRTRHPLFTRQTLFQLMSYSGVVEN